MPAWAKGMSERQLHSLGKPAKRQVRRTGELESKAAFEASVQQQQARHAELTALREQVGQAIDEANATATPLIVVGDMNVDLRKHPSAAEDPDVDTAPAIRRVLPTTKITRIPFKGEAGGKIDPTTATRYHDEGEESAKTVIDGMYANGWALHGLTGQTVEAATRTKDNSYKDHVPIRTTVSVQDIKHATDATVKHDPGPRYKNFGELDKTTKDAMVQDIVRACADPELQQARKLQERMVEINTKYLQKTLQPVKRRKPGINPEIAGRRQEVAILLDDHARAKKALRRSGSLLETVARSRSLRDTNTKLKEARARLREAKVTEAQRLVAKHKRDLHQLMETKPKEVYATVKGEFTTQAQVAAVTTKTGELLTQPDDVHEELVNRWQTEIFGTNKTEISQEFEAEYLSLLEPIQDLQALDDPFTAKEIGEALRSVNKAGACIGVPLTALHHGGTKIAEAIAGALNSMAKKDGGLAGLSDARITLIPKQGGTSLDALKLRPIQVTSAIYRVYAKTVDKRLRAKLLPGGALSSYQYAFTEGKAASDIPVMIALLFEQATRPGKSPQIVAAVDFQKMYDSLPRWAVLAILSRLGVPSNTLKQLTDILQDREVHFKTKLGTSKSFKPQNGVCQGCPLACLFSALVADLPLRKLNKTASGSQLGPAVQAFGKTAMAKAASKKGTDPEVLSEAKARLSKTTKVKAVGYVDDVTLFPQDRAELHTMIKQLNRWCEVSGMRIHPDKCGWLTWQQKQARRAPQGETPDTVHFFGKDLPEEDELKILGVYFNKHNITANTTKVLDECLTRARRIAAYKNMFPETKVKLFEDCVISKLRYAPLALHLGTAPVAAKIEELQAVIDEAVRKEACAPVLSKEVLHDNIKDGGYQVPYVTTSIRTAKIAELQRILNADGDLAKIVRTEMDRIANQVRYRCEERQAAATTWVQDPPFANHDELAGVSGEGLSAADTIYQALADAKKLKIKIVVQDTAEAAWSPAPGHYPEATRELAKSAKEEAAGRRPSICDIVADGGFDRRGAFGPVCTTAGITYAFDADPITTDKQGKGFRFAGHASSFHAELVALESASYIALQVREGAPQIAIYLHTDPLSAIQSIVASMKKTACKSAHYAMIKRICELLRRSKAQLCWVPGHTDPTDATRPEILNQEADRRATKAMNADIVEIETLPPLPKQLRAPCQLLAEGLRVDAKAKRHLDKIARQGDPTKQAVNHAHQAPLQVRWRNLMPHAKTSTKLTAYQRSLLRRARSDAFIESKTSHGGLQTCPICGARHDDHWVHAVTCKRQHGETPLGETLAKAALAHGARRLENLLKQAIEHADAIKEEDNSASLKARRQRPLYKYKHTLRSAEAAIHTAKKVAVECTKALRPDADPKQRRRVLCALPTMDPKTMVPDGELVAVMAKIVTARAQQYLQETAEAAGGAPAAGAKTLSLATKKSNKAAKKGGRRKGKRSYKTYIGRVLKGLKGNFRISKKAM
eukprot:gene3460-1812_t